jgi:hypothetical protein
VTLYAGGWRKLTTLLVRATDATVTGLSARTENVAHKLYVDILSDV